MDRTKISPRKGLLGLAVLVLLGCARPIDKDEPLAPRNLKSSPGPLSLAQELVQRGFRCSVRSGGSVCVIPRVAVSGGFTYSQPIAVLVPPGVTRPSMLHLYLHGFRGVCEPTSATPEYFADSFDLLNQMNGAGAQALVFPMSQGKCTTYANELVPHFPAFLTWAKSLLKPSTSNWTVAGHSGAGAILASILAQNRTFTSQVGATILLDATYSMSTHLPKWQAAIRAHPQMKIMSVFVPGTSPATGSEQLKRGLPGARVWSEPSRTRSHCLVPKVDYGRLLERQHLLAQDLAADFE